MGMSAVAGAPSSGVRVSAAAEMLGEKKDVAAALRCDGVEAQA